MLVLHFEYLQASGPWAVPNTIFYAMINCAMTGCIWSTLILTIERFTAVHYPLAHKRYLTPFRDKTILIVTSMLAILFALPRYFEVCFQFCGFWF